MRSLKCEDFDVPLMSVGSVKFGQSKAIERYIAKKCGMYGTNDEEAAVIDCIAEHTRDIKEKRGKIFIGGMAPSHEKDLAIKKWYEKGELTEWLVILEKSLSTIAAQTEYCG